MSFVEFLMFSKLYADNSEFSNAKYYYKTSQNYKINNQNTFEGLIKLYFIFHRLYDI